jgi:hypothetical protein
LDVGRCGNAGRVRNEFADAFDIDCVFGRKQMSQGIGHSVLTFLGGQLQNLHVHFVSHFFRMSGSQRVPRHTKTACREHFFAVPVVGERSRFSHQRIDDVSIIDRCQLLADQPRHRLNQVSVMSHRDLFGTDAKVDELVDQPTGNRVCVGSHVDRAAARNSHALDDVVSVKRLVRQSIQVRKIIKELLPPVVVGSFDEVFHEGDVLLAALKVPAVTQQQRLFNAILEVPIRGFDITVFVGTASVRAFRFAVVISHQGRITLREFFPAGVVSHGRSQ